MWRVKLLRLLLAQGFLGLTLAWSPTVLAHGDLTPVRGGLVAWSRELSVELVVGLDHGLLVYVDDHGRPVDVADSTGTVTVTRGDEIESVHIAPDGSARLFGRKLALAAGDRIQVIVNFRDGRLVVARLEVPEHTRR
jgi:hypothetical protein